MQHTRDISQEEWVVIRDALYAHEERMHRHLGWSEYVQRIASLIGKVSGNLREWDETTREKAKADLRDHHQYGRAS